MNGALLNVAIRCGFRIRKTTNEEEYTLVHFRTKDEPITVHSLRELEIWLTQMEIELS